MNSLPFLAAGDSRMLLHLEDAVKEGYTKVVVHTLDTDIQQHNASTSLSYELPMELGKVSGI